MALTARIKRLERCIRNMPPAPCATCGAPIGRVPTLEVWNDAGEVLTPRCLECGFGLDAAGKPMTALPPGSARNVVILDELPPG